MSFSAYRHIVPAIEYKKKIQICSKLNRIMREITKNTAPIKTNNKYGGLSIILSKPSMKFLNQSVVIFTINGRFPFPAKMFLPRHSLKNLPVVPLVYYSQ